MFDYIYYRLYLLYLKKEKGISPISTSAMYLSFIQLLVIYSIVMIVNITMHGDLFKDLTDLNKNFLKIGIVIFALILDLFNYFYYKKRCKALIMRFKNHPLNKKFKVWMLYVVCTGLFLFPFLYRAILKML